MSCMVLYFWIDDDTCKHDNMSHHDDRSRAELSHDSKSHRAERAEVFISVRYNEIEFLGSVAIGDPLQVDHLWWCETYESH